MEASMTMTSGVGTPFFMAPEMATGTKHYTGAVDVFSFGIMAAQVMVGRLVYDSSDAFETEFGLLFSISLFFTTKPTTLSFSFVFHLSPVCHLTQNHSICGCSVPRTSTTCFWLFSQDEITDDCMLGCQPLFSSLFVFLFSPCFLRHSKAFDVIVGTLNVLQCFSIQLLSFSHENTVFHNSD